MDIKETVVKIIAEQAMVTPEDIKMTHTLADVGIDSMGIVECIFGIEEAFDISVPFDANNPGDSGFDLSSVAAIVEAVRALVKDAP